MTPNEKETVLKSQAVYPSNAAGLPEWYVEESKLTVSTGLTFYQSLVLNLSKNEHITGKRGQTATSIAIYITDVADKIIKEMTREGEK